MKRLFSKKSGFTLVEIVIAFAIFAIMAAMICGILETTINRRTQNKELEDDVKTQAQDLVAMDHAREYDSTKDEDGKIVLEFKDKDGKKMPMELSYQLKASNGDSDRAGVNYFVGNIEYDGVNGEVEYIPGEDPADPDADPSEVGGSSIMTRYDTRITGTKGISSIKLECTVDPSNPKLFTITATINDSGVDPKVKEHSQITIYFGENTANSKLATIKSLNGGNRSVIDKNGIDGLKYVKKVGNNAVNLHSRPGGFSSNPPVTFTVEFEEEIVDLGFGANGADGAYSSTENPNIYGAYSKDKPADDSGDE